MEEFLFKLFKYSSFCSFSLNIPQPWYPLQENKKEKTATEQRTAQTVANVAFACMASRLQISPVPHLPILPTRLRASPAGQFRWALSLLFREVTYAPGPGKSDEKGREANARDSSCNMQNGVSERKAASVSVCPVHSSSSCCPLSLPDTFGPLHLSPCHSLSLHLHPLDGKRMLPSPCENSGSSPGYAGDRSRENSGSTLGSEQKSKWLRSRLKVKIK